MRTFSSLLVALFFSASACAPPAEAPTPNDALAYFGIAEGRAFVFTGPGGQEEIHTYERNNSFADRETFDRIVRRGGFVEDDAVFTVEATLDGLQIVRFFECLGTCGVASAPVPMLPWPVEGGEALESEVTVSLTQNNSDAGTREERHRFQVGREPEALSLPAGPYEAFQVLWSRTIGERTDTAQLWFAPEVGFVISEGFDGLRFELSSAP